MKKLFLDTSSSGHHARYLNYLLSDSRSKHHIFIISERFNKYAKLYPHNVFFFVAENISDINLYRLIKGLNFEKLVVLNLDKRLLLTLLYGKAYEGILFKLDLFFISDGRKLRFKRLIIAYLSRRINSTIYTLNSSFEYPVKTKFLSDPVHISKQVNWRTKRSFEKVTIACLGRSTPRKNFQSLFDAILFLELSNLRIILSKDLHLKLAPLLENKLLERQIELRVVDDQLSEIEYMRVLNETDLFYCCYRNFYGSSGIISEAMLLDRFVLGSNIGVISMMLQYYANGFTANPNSIESIAAELKKCLNEKIIMNKLYNIKPYENNIVNFVDTLFT